MKGLSLNLVNMEFGLIFVIVIILLAWIYNFYNGANDCANAIATTVSTRALTPKQAVLLATALNFAGAFLTTKVAQAIGKSIVHIEYMAPLVILSGVAGAVVWAAIATHSGIPVSLTHSIVGGVIGAGLASYGWTAVNWGGLGKIVVGMITSPLGGFVGGFLLLVILFRLFKNYRPAKADFLFGKAQIFSASFMALSHGTNDAQNAMGVITIALLAGGFIDTFRVPFWVILSSAFFMGIGTYYGGKKVIHTMGSRISRIRTVHGFAAQTAAGGVIFLASFLGIPISTTHVISTSIMGTGSVQRFSAVRWGIVGHIIIAWVVTIPVAAIASALIYYCLNRLL